MTQRVTIDTLFAVLPQYSQIQLSIQIGKASFTFFIKILSEKVVLIFQLSYTSFKNS